MTIRSFSVSYADLDELKTMLDPMVRPDGRITLNRARNQVVVMGAEGQMETISALIQQLDMPPLNVQIQVSFAGASDHRSSGAGLHGSGQIVVQNGKVGGQVQLDPFLENRSSRGQMRSTQTLLAMSGRSASLFIGEEIPYADYFIQYGVHHGYIDAQVNWTRVGASLLVEPTVIGEGPMIRVRVTPEIRATVNGEAQRYQYAEAATELIVRDGESVRIGGMNKDEEFYSRFLWGGRQQGGAESLDILLTPRIMPVPTGIR